MFQIYSFDVLESTNDYAKVNYQQYDDHSVILAKKQTKGRGRFDRVWESQEDLTCSIIVKTQNLHMMMAPLVVTIALQQLGYQTQVKWPNDILLNGKKVCGILIEQCFVGNLWQATIVGIGVNLSPKKEEKASYIKEDVHKVLQAILEAYAYVYTLDEQTRYQMYRKQQYLLGKKLQRTDGVWDIVDVSEEGYLQIQQQKTMRFLKSEEVTLQQVYEQEVM